MRLKDAFTQFIFNANVVGVDNISPAITGSGKI
jgi:hypothetical protein